MCVAVAASAAAVMAQSGSMDKGQMDSQKMNKDGMVMVTGCLAEKSTGGGYLLNNAMMSSKGSTSSSTMTSAGTSGTAAAGTMTDKEKMDREKMGMSGDHMMMSYELSGGGDLKAHVGHKIEVSGSVDKATMDKMNKMKMDKMGDKPATGTMDTMDKDKKAMGHDTPMQLKVTSVKMISASCS